MNCPFSNAGKASAQIVPKTDITVTKGDTLTLTCKVNEETISIRWRKDGETITERAIIDTRLDEKKSKLALTEFGGEDNGEYSCEARNKLGTVARSVVTVNVKGKLFKQPNIIPVNNYVITRPPSMFIRNLFQWFFSLLETRNLKGI